MVWALLAILGVPLWLILGLLGAGLWNRRRFIAEPGVFAARYRQIDRDGDHRWSRKAHARWAHQVLLVNSGLALVRTTAYPVRSHAPGPDPVDCSKLGDHPVALTLSLDDGRIFELAAHRRDRDLLIEPFATEPLAQTE